MRTGHSTLQNYSNGFIQTRMVCRSPKQLTGCAGMGGTNCENNTRFPRLRVLANQRRSPLLLPLVFTAAASAFTGEWVDATIVCGIVAATVVIGYSREYSAEAAAAALRARVRTHTQVLRDGSVRAAPVDEIVPGDVVMLSAGSLVPADAVVIQASDCFVSEAVLTGESFPTQKEPERFLRLLRSTGPHAG
jgi:P-type Mg2+ transporter